MFCPGINIHHSIHISLAIASCKNTSNLEGHVLRRRRESETLMSTSNPHPYMQGLITVQVAERDMTTLGPEPGFQDSVQRLTLMPRAIQLPMDSFLLHELLSLLSHLLLLQSNAKEKHFQWVTKMSEQIGRNSAVKLSSSRSVPSCRAHNPCHISKWLMLVSNSTSSVNNGI